MAITNPQQAYANNSVTTASPGELTLMLYNGCIKFIRLAERAMADNNIEQKNINVQKAQAIIRELSITLKTDTDLAKNMLSLYEFLHERLVEANIKNDPAILKEVEEFVTEFRDTWKQVIQENRRIQQVGAGGRV
ncbi:flagellar export chaperone FliS [Domibacillus sp. A3M-37]|uniref:flagellar export chaperone FliS n=1 Tax=Domibacillus sp. A3M-37 TaxID=2962037 RepID=UPI0020B6BE09|nr:flagellar export chaperone FliS [Domibacillus sp. A3M-37]MCP3761194.1 flagellar export chaperone FliS [Domibacillus sp. A3M-37]